MQESVIYRSIQKEKSLKIARNLLQEGISVEVIARVTELSTEEIQQLQQQPESIQKSE